MTADDTDNLLLVLRDRQARYAIPATDVEEIIEIPAITPLPLQPEYLLGIFNYKGHAVPALSLQALCGDGAGKDEIVCVVLHEDDALMALTVDAAESLLADDGQRIRYDKALLDGNLIKLRSVIPGEPAVFVLDMKRVCKAIEEDLNQRTMSED